MPTTIRMVARYALLVLGMTLTVCASAGTAAAATPAVTAQAQAADAAFLAYAPPPSGGAGALCLVDTGVHANPDTTPALISATAVDGGSGDDVDPNGHGTTMAMIAGAAGKGMIGAWPQIKIVSVRATDVPSPGHEPSFQFDNYTEGMDRCDQQGSYHIHAIDLALSSTIPPSPDQAQGFAGELAKANGQNIAVVAAAGNQPGAVEEPASEPGVLAVGASTAKSNSVSPTSPGARCNFSASQDLTFYAPGCGLDEANAFADQPTCCGNGTSQASAFAAAVLVALMSYDPSLSYSKGEQVLLANTTDGNLDAAAAFRADGLGTIVEQGNANIPQPPTPANTTATSTPTLTPATTGLVVRQASWRHGVLTLVVSGLNHRRLRIELDYLHGRARHLTTRSDRDRIRTRRPRVVLLWLGAGKSAQTPITIKVT